MTELLNSELIEGSISSSRKFHEIFNIANGSSNYGMLASLIGNNISFFDSLAESIGNEVAVENVKKIYDKQHFNPKYGNAKNFFTRNIYLNPDKKIDLIKKREETSIITQGLVEYGLKIGIRGVQFWASEVDKYKTIEDIYNFLNSFSVYGKGKINYQRSRIELSKISKSFPLSFEQRKKIIASSDNSISLEDLACNSRFLEKNNNELKESITYLLFALHAQKYQNFESEYIDDLLEYYNILGYHSKYAKIMINENRQRYYEITDDQVEYLKYARTLVEKMIISIPEIDASRIQARAQEMAKYDPYSIRRSKVQDAIGTGGVMLTAILAKRPDILIHAGSTALSQIKLENNDNALEFLEKKFAKNGIDSDVFKTILDGRKSIIIDAELSE